VYFNALTLMERPPR